MSIKAEANLRWRGIKSEKLSCLLSCEGTDRSGMPAFWTGILTSAWKILNFTNPLNLSIFHLFSESTLNLGSNRLEAFLQEVVGYFKNCIFLALRCEDWLTRSLEQKQQILLISHRFLVFSDSQLNLNWSRLFQLHVFYTRIFGNMQCRNLIKILWEHIKATSA